jgi:hypothetical protein
MKNNLILAISYLNSINKKDVVSIMYEDGSHKKFCYKLVGDVDYRYIDLSKVISIFNKF